MKNVAPLSKGFMAAGLLGFLIVFIYTSYGSLPLSWGIAIGSIFFFMIVASIVSMTYGPVEEQL